MVRFGVQGDTKFQKFDFGACVRGFMSRPTPRSPKGPKGPNNQVLWFRIVVMQVHIWESI